ncbi:MAG: hypothetical protein ABIH51_00625 [Patescibacteria group bacterium]
MIDFAGSKFVMHLCKKSGPKNISNEWIYKKSVEINNVLFNSVKTHLSEFSIFFESGKQEEHELRRKGVFLVLSRCVFF